MFKIKISRKDNFTKGKPWIKITWLNIWILWGNLSKIWKLNVIKFIYLQSLKLFRWNIWFLTNWSNYWRKNILCTFRIINFCSYYRCDKKCWKKNWGSPWGSNLWFIMGQPVGRRWVKNVRKRSNFLLINFRIYAMVDI